MSLTPFPRSCLEVLQVTRCHLVCSIQGSCPQLPPGEAAGAGLGRHSSQVQQVTRLCLFTFIFQYGVTYGSYCHRI